MFKDSLTSYQNAARSAKAVYFSNINEMNHSKPKVLFSVIQSVVNPSFNTWSGASDALCECFLLYFSDKILNLRLSISPNSIVSLNPCVAPASWEAFDLINLQELEEVICKLKPSFCSYDIFHPRFLKLIIDSIGPGLVSGPSLISVSALVLFLLVLKWQLSPLCSRSLHWTPPF